MKMTKQQAICLRLAQWLGLNDVCSGISSFPNYLHYNGVMDVRIPFNPFESTWEGRAQFAECVIKAAIDGLAIKMRPAGETPDEYVANRCEAIFFAIGGEFSE